MSLRRQAEWCLFACRFRYPAATNDQSFADTPKCKGNREISEYRPPIYAAAHYQGLLIEKYGLKINGVIFVTRPMSGY